MSLLLDVEQVLPIVDFHIKVNELANSLSESNEAPPTKKHKENNYSTSNKQYQETNTQKQDNNLFFSIMNTCRKKIYRLLFIQQLEDKKIKYKSLHDGSILFLVTYKPLQIKSLTLSIFDDTWQVKVHEEGSVGESSKRTSIENSHIDSSTNRYSGSSNIQFMANSHTWKFIYDSKLVNHQSLDLFLKDLNGLASIIDLYHQLIKVLDSQNLHYRKYFQLENFSPGHISIKFEESNNVFSILTIYWKEDKFNIIFHNPLVKYFEFLINHERSIKLLLDNILRTKIIYLVSNGFLYNTDINTTRMLPGDFILVPLHINRLKLVFRNIYSIDLTFYSEEWVQIQDGYIHPGASNVHQSIPQFNNFMSQYEEAVANTDVKLVSSAKIISTLYAIHAFLANLYLLRHVNQVLSLEVEKDNSIKKDYKPDKLEITFSNKTIEGAFTVSNYSSLELRIIKLNDQSNNYIEVDLDETPTSNNDSDFLINYFRTSVVAAPYHREYLSGFLNMLSLPINLLKDIIKLLEKSKRSSYDLLLSGMILSGNILSFIHDRSNSSNPKIVVLVHPFLILLFYLHIS